MTSTSTSTSTSSHDRAAGPDRTTEREQDVVDRLVPLPDGSPVQALRHRRDKVVAATQGSDDALFAPASTAPPLVERLLVAHRVAERSGSQVLAAHYRGRLAAVAVKANAAGETDAGDVDAALARQPVRSPRLAAVLAFADTLALHPAEGDRAALMRLPAAGLSTAEVVALAQLIAFVAYQLRVVAGLQALAALGDGAVSETGAEAAVATATTPSPFVHPANLPKPGEPLRVDGWTSETLEWRAWLPVLELDVATPEQLAVLEASHPKAKTSDYYRLLAHQPEILAQRSTAFNAIMYAPGGLSRAERELASTVVSRVNGCVYCASVHAQRFEQLARRNDVIHQVFTTPQGAGTTRRERAIVDLAIALTEAPGRFDAEPVRAARAAGLDALEVLDALHATAIFAWANRLMLNLGEPVWAARG